MCIKCKSFKEITAGFSPTRIEENPGNEVGRCSTSVVLFDNAVGTFSVPHHFAAVIGLIFLIVVVLLEIVLF